VGHQDGRRGAASGRDIGRPGVACRDDELHGSVGTPDPAQHRPAILTVDDDPGVSRSVARDLRRHFGAEYRIVRAESGREALDALREMKLRAIRSRCCWPTTGCPR